MSLTDAAKALPPIDGRRPHVSTIWRWCKKGLKGVRLEHVRLGHRVCTSVEALARFSQRLADADEALALSAAGAPRWRTPDPRQGDLADAVAGLAAARI